MSMTEKSVLLGFVGDVIVDRQNPHEVFDQVNELLSSPDVVFGNLESAYTDTPEVAITAPLVVAPKAHNLNAFQPAGFTVLSMANNHIVDAGHEAMFETKERLNRQGVLTCGAGKNIADARQPAIVKRKGISIGFLAYSSVFPFGYEARVNFPGIAPMRAYNHFHEAFPGYVLPGYQPRVETIPDRDDEQKLSEDISALHGRVDISVASFHWGDHLRPFVLTDHERRTARFCVKYGADLVLGHHQHAMRGIEWFEGKPIFYGLGHFVVDCRVTLTEELEKYLQDFDPNSYMFGPREGWPLLPLHPDTRMNMLGWVQVDSGKITDAGFVPCRLRPDGRVTAVDPDSAEGQEVVEYIAACNRIEKLNGKIVKEGAPKIGGHRSVRIVPLA